MILRALLSPRTVLRIHSGSRLSESIPPSSSCQQRGPNAIDDIGYPKTEVRRGGQARLGSTNGVCLCLLSERGRRSPRSARGAGYLRRIWRDRSGRRNWSGRRDRSGRNNRSIRRNWSGRSDWSARRARPNRADWSYGLSGRWGCGLELVGGRCRSSNDHHERGHRYD